MRALVTGATGFIGKNLCEYLTAHGIGYDKVGRDWLVPIGYHYDFVFYLAGEVRKVQEMYDANVHLLYKMLCRFIHMTNSIFIYVGSSSEYGPNTEPIKETDIINPTNMYDATKGMGTLLCQGFARQFEKLILVVRPSSVYGKYERPEKFIPTLIRKISTGEELDIYSGVHDWIHVDDFLHAMFWIMGNDANLCGSIYNISSNEETDNLQIANMILDIMGQDAYPMNYKTEYLHKHCTEYWTVDNTKLLKLGWKPKYDLMSGLQKTVEEI